MKQLIRRVYHKIRLLFVKKQQRHQDVVIGKIYLGSPDWAEVGNKVICDRGIAHIKEIKETKHGNWYVLTYGYKQKVEKNYTGIYQFVVDIRDPYSGKKKRLPLSFSDYEYIDRNELGQAIEMTITKRKYAKLTAEVREGSKLLYLFNSAQGGDKLLKKIHDDGFIAKEGDLVTIKKK